MHLDEYMKAVGMTINERMRAMKDMSMATSIEEIFKKEKLMEKELILGQTVSHIQVIGLKDSNMAKEDGKE